LKKYLPKNKTLPLLIIIVIIGIVSEIVYNTKHFVNGKYIADTEQFQNVLHKKEKQALLLLDEFQAYYQKSGTNGLFNFANEKYNNLYTDEGLAVFIYENDSLFFWSENSVSVENSFVASGFSNNVVDLKSGFYVVHKKSFGNKVIVVAILIRKNAPHQNKYLNNQYQKDFSVPAHLNISLVYSDKIYDSNGNYLFSLSASEFVDISTEHSSLATTCFLLALVLLIWYANTLFVTIKRHQKPYYYTVIISAILIFVRVVMIKYQIPANIYTQEIFGPDLFGDPFLFYSLGDLLINAVLIILLTYNLFIRIKAERIVDFFSKKRQYIYFLVVILSISVAELAFVFSFYSFKSLIYNSKIPFEIYKVAELNTHSYIAFLVIGLLFGTVIIIIDKVIVISFKLISLQQFFVAYIFSLLLVFPLFYFSENSIDFRSILFFVIISIIVIFIRQKNHNYQYYTNILIVFLFSVYTVFFIVKHTQQHEKNQRVVIAENNGLINNNDLVAESKIMDIEFELYEDEDITKFVQTSDYNKESLMQNLRQKYFNGYMESYDLIIEKYGLNDSMEVEEKNWKNTRNYYDSLIFNKGKEVGFSYTYIENQDGTITYLKKFSGVDITTSDSVFVLISLKERIFHNELGYPALLLDAKYVNTIIAQYSIAKYINNKLVSKNRDYHYNYSRKAYGNYNEKAAFLILNNYSHLILNIDANTTVIISKPVITPMNILMAFAYVFVFFYLLFNIVVFSGRLPLRIQSFRFDFKTRLQFSLISILSVALLIIGATTIIFTVNQYKSKHSEQLSAQMNSVLREMEYEFRDSDSLNYNWENEQFFSLSEFLTKIRNVIGSDINLYSPTGSLIASSRHEIFSKGLLSQKIHLNAYRELVINEKTILIQDEQIGDYQFTSGYIPLKNSQNKILAYIQLPHFTQQLQLKREIMTFVVAIINVYALLILISIIIAIFIANRISHPLRLIQDKLQQVKLDKKNEQIFYEREDEIGSLIKEYNRMVAELTTSAELLAKSEREGAWREMAKQIAHEIKNPLTPMKLSMQLLYRSWKDNDPNFGVRMEKVSNTIIEQIDRLSSIATGFSSFAKMPKAENRKVDIAQIVKNCVHLFESTEKIAITYEIYNSKYFWIYADDKQMSQVFINLIKNGTQAFTKKHTNCFVKLSVYANQTKVTVRVEDNGVGIPDALKEKLFRPNFTTKTSGMGMGLSIVKNIVENANGRIWFVTEYGKGTTFFVELPLIDDNEDITN